MSAKKMDVRQAAYVNLAKLTSQGFRVDDEDLTDNWCTAMVSVNRIPFRLIAGKLSAIAHYEIPTLRIFPAYLQDAISQLRKLGYSLRVGEFRTEAGRLEFCLEVVLQLWEGGGVILSLKLTDEHLDVVGVDTFLRALRTVTVTLPKGCSVSFRGAGDFGKIQKVMETLLGQHFHYVLVQMAPCEWVIHLPGVLVETGLQISDLANATAGVTGYAEIELRIPAHQE